MLFWVVTVDCDVVQVDDNAIVEQIVEYVIEEELKAGGGVAQPISNNQ